ncbi:MAG: hypothetical protein QM619_00780 [Micropruina sp.]|uniref:hypothetical protein n=1 Tax=Micropruina sp. TaxID=2737536 RepID=UPI0039E338F6
MSCDHYLKFENGTGVCLDLVVPYRRKWPWPPDPDWLQRLKDLVTEGVGPVPDPRRGVVDILDSVQVPGVEQGGWSRDITRVVMIADLVSQLESAELRESLGAELRTQSDQLVRANMPGASLGLSV